MKALPTTSGQRTRSLAAARTGSRTSLAAMTLPPAGLRSGLTGSWSRSARQSPERTLLSALSARRKEGHARLRYPVPSVHAGIRTEMDLMERGLGAQLAHASKSADFAVVIGKREAESGTVTLKNLQTGEQKPLDLAGCHRRGGSAWCSLTSSQSSSAASVSRNSSRRTSTSWDSIPPPAGSSPPSRKRWTIPWMPARKRRCSRIFLSASKKSRTRSSGSLSRTMVPGSSPPRCPLSSANSCTVPGSTRSGRPAASRVSGSRQPCSMPS